MRYHLRIFLCIFMVKNNQNNNNVDDNDNGDEERTRKANEEGFIDDIKILNRNGI